MDNLRGGSFQVVVFGYTNPFACMPQNLASPTAVGIYRKPRLFWECQNSGNSIDAVG